MKRPGALYLGLAIIFFAGLANAHARILQFESSVVNQAAIIGMLLLPFVMLGVAFVLPRWLLRIPAALVAIVLALPCSLLALFVWMNFAATLDSGYNPAFESLHRLNAGPSSLVVYRTNGGATTAFGIVVQHERRIVPGLLLVRPVFGAYPAKDAEITAKTDTSFEVRVAEYDDGTPSRQEMINVFHGCIGEVHLPNSRLQRPASHRIRSDAASECYQGATRRPLSRKAAPRFRKCSRIGSAKC